MMGMMILYGLKTFAALLKSRKSHLYKKYEKKYMTSSYLIQKLSYSVGPCPPRLTLASLNDHVAGKKNVRYLGPKNYMSSLNYIT